MTPSLGKCEKRPNSVRNGQISLKIDFFTQKSEFGHFLTKNLKTVQNREKLFKKHENPRNGRKCPQIRENVENGLIRSEGREGGEAARCV